MSKDSTQSIDVVTSHLLLDTVVGWRQLPARADSARVHATCALTPHTLRISSGPMRMPPKAGTEAAAVAHCGPQRTRMCFSTTTLSCFMAPYLQDGIRLIRYYSHTTSPHARCTATQHLIKCPGVSPASRPHGTVVWPSHSQRFITASRGDFTPSVLSAGTARTWCLE